MGHRRRVYQEGDPALEADLQANQVAVEEGEGLPYDQWAAAAEGLGDFLRHVARADCEVAHEGGGQVEALASVLVWVLA